MSHPERKQNRLMGYDYSQNGAYFITVCVQNRAEILEKIVGDGVVPALISTLKRMIHRKIGFPIFQRSYHDHIIRNEREYEKFWNCIDGTRYAGRKIVFIRVTGKHL